MGLEEIKKDIEQSRDREIAQIETETRNKLQQLEQELKDFVQEKKKHLQNSLEEEKERRMQIKEAESQGEAAHLVLEKKRELIEEAIQEAKKELSKKRESYLKSILKKAQRQMKIARVYCNKQDAKFLKGVKATVGDIDGGLISENSDGSVSINYSFDTVVGGIKEKYLQEIAQELFR
ncbi:hypothetical protein GOV09_03760 [Candidatus Woesearchaeota archaeon]|nr:hypothetical protein [Candidatus Woesearchaeota archaeon]